ncbi:MAG: acyl carrier protein [Verrucomicrobiota bacterium]
MQVTIDQLREIIVKAEITSRDPNEFDPAVPLRQQGIDSLDMATFVFFTEVEFDISIPHKEYPRLATLNEIAAALSEHGEAWSSRK